MSHEKDTIYTSYVMSCKKKALKYVKKWTFVNEWIVKVKNKNKACNILLLEVHVTFFFQKQKKNIEYIQYVYIFNYCNCLLGPV